MASPLSIATSIIHAASQVCSTSGISGTDDPLPSPGPVAVSLKPTSPATNQPLSSPSTPKVSQVSPSTPKVSQVLPSTLKVSQVVTDANSPPERTSGNTSNSTVSAPQLTSGETTQIFLKSCSRKNFATLLAKNLFTEEVRKTSNVSGKNNKQQLDPKIIEYIKTLTFERWPLAQAEKLEMEWGECKRAIDEGNRRLNRNPTLKKSN